MLRFIQKRPIFSSIRSKLITLLLVLSGLPLLITAFLSYQSASDALLKQTTHQLGNLADKTAQQIDGFFQSINKDLGMLADYPFVQLAFLQYEFKQRLDSIERLLVDYSEKNPYFSHIYLIGLDGKPILIVPPGGVDHQNFAHEPWFLRTLQEGRFVSDVQQPGHVRQKGIFIGNVVRDYEKVEQPVGVLAFHLKTASYTGFAKSLQIGSGGYAFLLHHTGNMIFHPENKPNFAGDLSAGGDARFRELILRMASAEQGHGLYSFSGQEKFLVFSRCQERPWSLGITVMKDELMGDIRKFLKKMLTFLAVLVVLILPVSYFFIKSIMRPINQLIIGAGRIGSGDLNQTIRIQSNDELRAVAEEFNKMVVRLKTSMDEIIDLKNFNEDILRNVTSGIITVDRTGQITSLNPSAERILDYHFMLQGGCSEPRTPPCLRETLLDLEDTLKNGRNVQNKELAIVRTNEEPAFVEINTSLLSSKTGKVFGAIADIRDITQRKRMEEVMLRVEKLASLGELSAGMAHEIRNPLAGMKTSVQVLARRVTQPEYRELLKGIESEINRLDRIVGDLLRFSRPAAPVFESLDIGRVLEQLLELMSEKIKIHGIAVEKRFDPKTPDVFVDREQIRQVFLNLMLNSIKAMASSGLLTIEVAPATERPEDWGQSHRMKNMLLSRYVKVMFADTGHGISSEHLQKIFDPFFSTDPKGTGLGLSIVHKLIDENNGRIVIESVKDEGTRAILLLPAAREEEP